VIHWPAGIKARGEVRHQYHHCTDIVPTIYEACGVEFPEVFEGIEQTPLSGVSMAYSFDASDAVDAPSEKKTQYYEMFGSRGIWHEGWKAVTEHGPGNGKSGFDKDRWQLFHTAVDRSEANDLAEEQPQKLEELKALWLEEAKANNVLPLNDLQILGNPQDFETFIKMEFHIPVPPSGQYTYYPGTSEIPERSAANVHGVSYKVLAEVDLNPGAEGVIFAHGSRFGGHAMFVKDGQLTYAYNFLGVPPEDRISAPLPTSGRHILGVEFTKTGAGQFREATGPLKLYIDDEQVGEQEIRTVLGHFSLCGEGLCIGYDSGDAVSSAYAGSRFEFTGGEIKKVVFDIADDAYVDVEAHLAAAMARD
jgi:arylsulfatase